MTELIGEVMRECRPKKAELDMVRLIADVWKGAPGLLERVKLTNPNDVSLQKKHASHIPSIPRLPPVLWLCGILPISLAFHHDSDVTIHWPSKLVFLEDGDSSASIPSQISKYTSPHPPVITRRRSLMTEDYRSIFHSSLWWLWWRRTYMMRTF